MILKLKNEYQWRYPSGINNPSSLHGNTIEYDFWYQCTYQQQFLNLIMSPQSINHTVCAFDSLLNAHRQLTLFVHLGLLLWQTYGVDMLFVHLVPCQTYSVKLVTLKYYLWRSLKDSDRQIIHQLTWGSLVASRPAAFVDNSESKEISHS